MAIAERPAAWGALASRQDVAHCHRVPAPSPRGPDAPRIQRVRDVPQGAHARPLNVSDNREHVGRVLVRSGSDGLHRELAGLTELRTLLSRALGRRAPR